MKKLLLFVAFLFALTLMAKPLPKGFSFRKGEIKADDVKQQIEIQKADKDYRRLSALLFMNYCIEKNFPEITYLEYKKIWTDLMKDVTLKHKWEYDYFMVLSTFLRVNYQNLYKGIIFDKSLSKPARHYVLFNILPVYTKFVNATEFRNILNDEIIPILSNSKTARKNLKPKRVLKVLNAYASYRLELKPAEMQSDLQKMKLLLYPLIQEGDAWKPVLVKLEVLIKTIQ